MTHSDDHAQQMPFFLKALILVVVGIFLAIGLIGLILPIIPGILFLALAAFLLAKISSRFAFFLHNNASWIRLKRYLHSVSFLSIAQQIKLSLWVAARAMVKAIESGIQLLRNARKSD